MYDRSTLGLTLGADSEDTDRAPAAPAVSCFCWQATAQVYPACSVADRPLIPLKAIEQTQTSTRVRQNHTGTHTRCRQRGHGQSTTPLGRLAMCTPRSMSSSWANTFTSGKRGSGSTALHRRERRANPLQHNRSLSAGSAELSAQSIYFSLKITNTHPALPQRSLAACPRRAAKRRLLNSLCLRTGSSSSVQPRARQCSIWLLAPACARFSSRGIQRSTIGRLAS